MNFHTRTNTVGFAGHFTDSVRRLFFSNLFEMIADGLTGIFISAFIWRVTGSFIAVAMYPLGQFLLQPFIFGLNGLLLRRMDIRHTFFFGSLLVGITSMAVVFFARETSPFAFFLLGSLRGIGNGFYWPNRNYLELQEVTDGARNYYFSMLQAAGWITNTILPFIAGWFIVFGPRTNWYTTLHAYWAIFFCSLVFLFIAAVIVVSGTYTSHIPRKITRFSLQKFWNDRCILNLTEGVISGASFISPLVVLAFLGNEGILGTTTALAALCAAGLVYVYGRYSAANHRYQLSLLSSIVFLCCTLALVILPNPFNAIIYALFAGIASNFFSVGIEPILLAHSDGEMNGDGHMRYSFIFDNELFLNIGRVCGISLLVILAAVWSEKFALVYGALFIGIIQIVLFVSVLNRKRRGVIHAD